MSNYLGSIYKVGPLVFTHKMEAILHANKTLADVTWEFNKGIFNSVNWLVEPETSLDDFYRIRAQQIRDKYDYVVILCSGGADSTNVIKSFLYNGIMPDEVIAGAPMEGLRDYKFNSQDTSHENTISETIYAQMPLIRDIASNFPNIKVTIHDYFEDMLAYKGEEWAYQCEDWLHPSSAARYCYEKHAHLKKLAEAGKRIAFVYGIDKPTIIKDLNGDLHTVFVDLTVNVQRPPFSDSYPNVENVLFYWTPELPEMLVKQAHVVAKWIHLPENSRSLSYMYDASTCLTESFSRQRYRHSKYEREIVPALYPTTHRKVFQAEKPESLFLGEHDAWFYKHHRQTMTYEMLISDVSSLFKKINPKYLNKGKNGFEIYFNRYKIGNINQFKPDVFR